jgi:hypothetical protein
MIFVDLMYRYIYFRILRINQNVTLHAVAAHVEVFMKRERRFLVDFYQFLLSRLGCINISKPLSTNAQYAWMSDLTLQLDTYHIVNIASGAALQVSESDPKEGWEVSKDESQKAM